MERTIVADPAGAPPLDAWFDHCDGTNDTWTLTTQPSKLAHYAMWPAKLAERLILSMCPAEVCNQCGEPRRRVEGKTPEYAAFRQQMAAGEGLVTAWDANVGNRAQGFTGSAGADSAARGPKYITEGWTSCPCGAPFTPGIVLDPFVGSGTTCCVAELHGRDSIGIDLDPRNRDLLDRRMAEVSRNLFDSPMPDTNQLDLFGDIA